MEIILYSTGCPKCNVLKKKLTAKGITYTENNNTEQMVALGIDTVPILNVNGKLLNFQEAAAWVNESEVNA